MEIKIQKRDDSLAQRITIPRDIVMESSYPFKREAKVQRAVIRIDKEAKVLIIEPINETE